MLIKEIHHNHFCELKRDAVFQWQVWMPTSRFQLRNVYAYTNHLQYKCCTTITHPHPHPHPPQTHAHTHTDILLYFLWEKAFNKTEGNISTQLFRCFFFYLASFQSPCLLVWKVNDQVKKVRGKKVGQLGIHILSRSWFTLSYNYKHLCKCNWMCAYVMCMREIE